MKETQVIVVGGGIAGSAAALRAAQYGLRTAWILGDRKTAKGSRGHYVHNIDNMIGVHEGVLKDQMLAIVDPISSEAAASLRAKHLHIGTQAIIDNTLDRVQSGYVEQVEVVEAAATSARLEAGRFTVKAGDATFIAPHLVLATGVADKQPRIKKALPSGKTLDDIHWVFPYANHETLLYCIRCEGHLTRGTPTAVIGSSPAAGQVALMLHERYDTPVTILTNGETPELPERTSRLLDHFGIGVRTERLVQIRGEKGAGELRGFDLEEGPAVEVRFAFVLLGLHRVYNDLAVQLGCDLEPDAPVETAHVVVGNDAETSRRGCFAVGDMAIHEDGSIRKQVYTAQEYAVRALDRIDARTRAARRDEILG